MALEINGEMEKEIQAALAEAREIMRVLELPAAAASGEELLRSLMLTGLGLLRAHKRQHDEVKAAAAMARRIQNGPRLTAEEALRN